jgi:hypothetical protein
MGMEKSFDGEYGERFPESFLKTICRLWGLLLNALKISFLMVRTSSFPISLKLSPDKNRRPSFGGGSHDPKYFPESVPESVAIVATSE